MILLAKYKRSCELITFLNALTTIVVNITRDVFRIYLNIYDRYDGAFFAEIVNDFQLLIIFAKKLNHRCLKKF